MYKDILRKIYKEVKNAKNNKKPPRIIDYANAVFEHITKNPQPLKTKQNQKQSKNDNAKDKNVESIRRSVTAALNALEKEQLLGKADRFYVPKEIADKYNARLFLIDNLWAEHKKAIMYDEKVFVITLAEQSLLPNEKNNDSSDDNNQNTQPDTTNPECVTDNTETTMNPTAEDNELVDIPESSLEIKTLKNIIQSLQQELSALKNTTDILKHEVHVLKYQEIKQMKINEIMENLVIYIGKDYVYDIYNSQDNIFIILDLSDNDIKKDKHIRLLKKLNLFIKEIERIKRPNFFTDRKEKKIKKDVYYHYKKII